jgi:HEXXH motif-containing protein
MFHPSRLSGTLGRLRMAERVDESLAYLSAQTAAVAPAISNTLQTARRNVAEGRRLCPSVYATYFETVAALEEDRFAEAAQLSCDLATLTSSEQLPLATFAMSESSLGPSRHRQVSLHFSDGYFGQSFLGEPSAEAVSIRTDQVQRALQRMQSAVPELYAELEETISEIIFANGAIGADGYTFDGASSLEYWGAIVLNTAVKKTDLQVFEMLAHECGHNILFALSPVEFFVYNTDEERHASPLREDPRPLDGIYHATFVTARMHYAVTRLAQSGQLTSAGERQEAVRLTELYRSHFDAGHSVLARHANFTPSGERIMADTKAYMDRSLQVG